jgi:transposase
VIEVTVSPHAGIRGRCSQCQQPAPGYDRLPERRWEFVPLWGIPVRFRYATRRVECLEHGIVVEHIPWSDGKSGRGFPACGKYPGAATSAMRSGLCWIRSM